MTNQTTLKALFQDAESAGYRVTKLQYNGYLVSGIGSNHGFGWIRRTKKEAQELAVKLHNLSKVPTPINRS